MPVGRGVNFVLYCGSSDHQAARCGLGRNYRGAALDNVLLAPPPACRPVLTNRPLLHPHREPDAALRLTSHGVTAAVWFRMVGGRFRTVCHSSLMFPGAHACESIPARPHIYATTKERDLINQLGRTHGCHTCGHRPVIGSWPSRSYNADHQPPNKYAAAVASASYFKTPAVRFYPQCTVCSSDQGGAAMAAAKRSTRVPLKPSHPTAYGLAHLWLPHSVFIDRAVTNGKNKT